MPPEQTTPTRFTIAEPDRVSWGKLVKAWSKGEQPLPRSLDELVQQCQDRGFTPGIPSYMKALVFVVNDKHALTIRLPPKDMLEAGEQAIRDNPQAGYPIPDFYSAFFRDPPPSAEEKLELHAARIGEYTMNICQ